MRNSKNPLLNKIDRIIIEGIPEEAEVAEVAIMRAITRAIMRNNSIVNHQGQI